MMKETIYTIPISEAYETDCECPLCLIEKKLEAEAVEYELGPAMMEPDHRELSNEKGFCNKHYGMLFASENKLPLALVMDTHIDTARKKVEGMKKIKKSGILKKARDKESCADMISSCMVCDKIRNTMERYRKVLIEMWKEDNGFREVMAKSKGFCIPHFEQLYQATDDAEFLTALADLESAELDRIKDDIHRFTLKFDYRNKDMEWGSAKDAPIRTVEKVAGYITRKITKE